MSENLQGALLVGIFGGLIVVGCFTEVLEADDRPLSVVMVLTTAAVVGVLAGFLAFRALTAFDRVRFPPIRFPAIPRERLRRAAASAKSSSMRTATTVRALAVWLLPIVAVALLGLWLVRAIVR